MPSGKVLITGGFSTQRMGNIVSAELYDPATGSFEPTGNTLLPRSWHAATLLRDGTVLLTGGYNAGVAEIHAEIYDPTNRVFTPVPNLHFSRILHTATSLSGGSVAIIGGADSTDGIRVEFINSAEIYGRAGSISASPNPCVLSGALCTTYLTWSTSGISNAQVWVSIGDGPETNFATAPSCQGTDCAAPWIQGKNARAIASVQVRGIDGLVGTP